MALLRYTAVAALAASVRGFAIAPTIGAIPSQTIGVGQPFFDIMPTEAPSPELLKKRLEKKAITNVCSEWTILGGEGQPQCYNSQTCLFTTVGDYYYEGCGQTSIAYDWITECWNYPQTQTGTPGPSETFCDAAAPSCGYFAFVYTDGYTFSNFGCSSASYAYTATLLPTGTSSQVGLDGGSSSLTLSVKTVTVTPSATSTPSTPSATGINTTPTVTPLPKISTSKKKSTPIGAIVGGVIGGIALIAFLAFLLWFFMRKNKQDKANATAAGAEALNNNQYNHPNNQQVQQQQADVATAAAFSNLQHQRMSEIDGTMKPAAAYVPPPNEPYLEKPLVTTMANEYRPPAQSQYSSGYGSDPHNGSQSPPPVYAQPQTHSPPQQHTPNMGSPAMSQYTELDPNNISRQSVPPVSPQGPGTGTYMGTASELGGGENRPSYQAYSPPPQAHEMSGGAATGGIVRPQVGRQQPDVDMSGAPMSDNYRHHELP